MAEIDHAKFAAALSDRLREIGYSLSRATEKWPQTNKAMLSRAASGKVISAGNLLLICHLAGLDPFAFLIMDKQPRMTMKSILKQTVTAVDKRETGSLMESARHEFLNHP